jgi:DME family drug/metabolite transporter
MTVPRKERLYGILLVLLASMCWGTTGTLQELAPAGAHPLTIGSIRITLSALILLPWCAWRDAGLGFLRRTSIPSLLAGAAGLTGFQFAFFTALKLTGVSVGTMIAIGASPMFAGALALLVRREPLSARWFVSTLVAMLGCVLLLLGGSSGPMLLEPYGIGLAFTASFCYALMGLGFKMQGTRLNDAQTIAVTTGASAFIALPVLIALDSSWIITGAGLAISFSLGFATMALPMSLFSLGLRKIYLRDAYTISLAEPLTACVLSALVLGERLSPLSIAGAGLIFCGILLLPVDSEGGNGRAERLPAAELPLNTRK